MAVFAALICTALLFDVYVEKNSVEISKIETEQEESKNNTNTVYLIAQSNSVSVKSSLPKTQVRKIQLKSHDKLIQKHHQLRNFQVFKAEVDTQTTPLITSYHYLIFQRHFFGLPDEEVPLIS